VATLAQEAATLLDVEMKNLKSGGAGVVEIAGLVHQLLDFTAYFSCQRRWRSAPWVAHNLWAT
jgi:hypothetical protein